MTGTMSGASTTPRTGPPGEPPASERHPGKGAQHGRQPHDGRRDGEAGGGRFSPVPVGQELGVPAEREIRRREHQPSGPAERHRDQGQDRHQEEEEDEASGYRHPGPHGIQRGPAPNARSSWRSRYDGRRTSSVAPSKTTERADAIGQLRVAWMFVSMSIVTSVTRPPPRRAGVMKNPRPMTNKSTVPAATPGRLSGK